MSKYSIRENSREKGFAIHSMAGQKIQPSMFPRQKKEIDVNYNR